MSIVTQVKVSEEILREDIRVFAQAIQQLRARKPSGWEMNVARAQRVITAMEFVLTHRHLSVHIN